MAKQLIETITVGAGGAASITFSNIPQDYTDLILVTSLRSNRSNNYDNVFLKINGTYLNRSLIRLQGNGSSASSSTTVATRLTAVPAATATSNTFSNDLCCMTNYTSSANKAIFMDHVMEDNATTSYAGIQAVLWSDTSAITSLLIEPDVGTELVTGSTASLYGWTAGNDGTTTVS